MYSIHLECFNIVHTHGHSFQVLYRSPPNAGVFNPRRMPAIRPNPVRRDVIVVNAGGYAVIAFRADNPGCWFLCVPQMNEITSSHCHIDWHLVSGMIAQFVEAPLQIQWRIQVPHQISKQCISQGIPISGPGNG